MIEQDVVNDIRINSVVLRVLLKYINKTKNNNLEYGGILFGRVNKDGVISIEFASQPNKYDISGKLYFIRNRKISQIIINKTWEISKGEINYLGEWHTHPFNSNVPSHGDELMIKSAYIHNDNSFNFLVLIIASINNRYSVNLVTKKSIILKGDYKIEGVYNKC